MQRDLCPIVEVDGLLVMIDIVLQVGLVPVEDSVGIAEVGEVLPVDWGGLALVGQRGVRNADEFSGLILEIVVEQVIVADGKQRVQPLGQQRGSRSVAGKHYPTAAADIDRHSIQVVPKIIRDGGRLPGGRVVGIDVGKPIGHSRDQEGVRVVVLHGEYAVEPDTDDVRGLFPGSQIVQQQLRLIPKLVHHRQLLVGRRKVDEGVGVVRRL